MLSRLSKLPLFLIGGVVLAFSGWMVVASDHDDGEINAKGRALNLTDLFVFREIDQNASATAGNLILIMNSNPRSLPGQQYYFSSTARYEFHASRVTSANKAVRPTGSDDVTLRFEFAEPDATALTQAMTITSIKDGTTSTATATTAGAAILTTPLPGTTQTVSTVTVGGADLTVFAGLREDPFFFDVKQYFLFRAAVAAGTAGSNLAGGFNPGASAEDFAHGYNVNSIVVRVPTTWFQSTADDTVLDFWETISVRN